MALLGPSLKHPIFLEVSSQMQPLPEAEPEAEPDTEGEAEGVAEAEGEAEGVAEAEGEAEGVAEGEGEPEADGEGEALQEHEEDEDEDGDGDGVIDGDSVGESVGIGLHMQSSRVFAPSGQYGTSVFLSHLGDRHLQSLGVFALSGQVGTAVLSHLGIFWQEQPFFLQNSCSPSLHLHSQDLQGISPLQTDTFPSFLQSCGRKIV